MRRIPVLLVAIATTFGGCFAAESDSKEDGAPAPAGQPATVKPQFDFDKAIVFEHNHADPSLHRLSYGMRLVGHTPLSEASRPGTLPGQINEVSVGTNLAVVATYGPNRVFGVVNVSSPAQPRHMGDWWGSDVTRPGATSAWGLAIFPEDDLVAVSAQVMANPSANELGGGLFLVNLDDPSRPQMESFTQVVDGGALIAVGVHTVRVFTVNDTRYVAASTANGKTQLFEIVGEKPSRALKFLSNVTGNHDTAVQVHPLTGQRILYGAKSGMFLTDITDPLHPRVLSTIPNGQDGMSAYHQVVPSDVLIGGRHYTVAATEDAQGRPTPFTLVDTTDPETPNVVGRWRLPIVLPQGIPTTGNAYRFTGHNLDFDRGRLYIGHSHAGVWVVDVSSEENLRAPFPIAFYQPHEDVPHGPINPFSTTDVPATWSAYRHTDGLVYASDPNSGLYILAVTEPPSPLENATVYPHNVR